MAAPGDQFIKRLVDQVGAGAPEVRHREQREAGQPGRVALPVEPVQVLGQLGRRNAVLHRVVEAAAVHGPQFAAHALLLQVLVDRRREAGIEEDEVERGADPGDGGDDVSPAQQQVGPVEEIAFHVSLTVEGLLTTAGALSSWDREQQESDSIPGLRCGLCTEVYTVFKAAPACRICAATLAAITSGSLPVMPGTPIGQVTRASSPLA